MKKWNVGDRSNGICERCEKLVATRFESRTLVLESPSTVSVPDVLVASCVVCGEIVSIPYQSVPMLREARRSAAVAAGVSLHVEATPTSD